MARFKIVSGESWEYDYNGHKIVVRNSVSQTSLEVDGKVQDIQNGITLSATLTGKVDGKKIKASLGGVWNMNCDLFVDHEKLDLVKKN